MHAGDGGRFKGKWVLLAMAVVALAMAGALYRIAAGETSEEYRRSRPGAPERTLRIASIDMRNAAKVGEIAACLREVRPDIVLAQHITRESLIALARELGLGQSQQVYYSPLNLESRTLGGCGIICRQSLHRQRELLDGNEGSFAVAAETIVDGRRFLLVSSAAGGANMVEQSRLLRKTLGTMRVGAAICGGQLGSAPHEALRVALSDTDSPVHLSPHWRLLRAENLPAGAWVEVAGARQ